MYSMKTVPLIYPRLFRLSFPLPCDAVRRHSLSSAWSSLLRVSLVSVNRLRSSSAIRPDTKSGRPDFLGFSNRIVVLHPQDVLIAFGSACINESPPVTSDAFRSSGSVAALRARSMILQAAGESIRLKDRMRTVFRLRCFPAPTQPQLVFVQGSSSSPHSSSRRLPKATGYPISYAS